jgi:hypothetical protein
MELMDSETQEVIRVLTRLARGDVALVRSALALHERDLADHERDGAEKVVDYIRTQMKAREAA